MKQPPLGWTTPVKLKRVIDGDTIHVILEKELVIRITDDKGTYNTPEVRRKKDVTEKELQNGYKAKLELISLLHDEDIVLYIPTNKQGKIADIFSIGSRVVGQLFIKSNDKSINVADKMTKLGYNKSSDNYKEGTENE